MSARLTLPAYLGARSVPEWITAWRESEGEAELEIELAPGCDKRPGALALLASRIAWRTAKRLRSRIVAAEGAESVLVYLEAIDFFTALGTRRAKTATPTRAEHRFVGPHAIRDLASARELAQQTASSLEATLPGVHPSRFRDACVVFEELGANIVQHSESPQTGFGLANALPERAAIELAFADHGIGFLRSLQKNPELAGRVGDDGEALQLALEEGVTSNPHGGRNMGFGLAELRRISDRHDGELWIASGTALLRRRTVVANKRATTIHRIDPWHGSWICLEVPVGSPPSTLPRTAE